MLLRTWTEMTEEHAGLGLEKFNSFPILHKTNVKK